jgi:hypothetical protein
MARMLRAFYRRREDGWWIPEAHTRGPWSAMHQHGGPPSALLARALERYETQVPVRVVRITLEILRPIPIQPVRIAVTPLESGRRAQRLQADLVDGDGQTLCRALALRLRRAEVAVPPDPATAEPLRPAPADAPLLTAPFDDAFFAGEVGYHVAMELRVARGGWGQSQVAAWLRTRLALVEGETPSPLERVMLAADSGNGITAALDPSQYTFVNPDLTVHLHREAEGEWVGLDATMITESNGTGAVRTVLHDVRGPIGVAVQSLLVEQRRR